VGEAIIGLWLIRPIILGCSSDMSRRGASIRKYDPAKNQSNYEERGLAKERPYIGKSEYAMASD
jgi:hypothetical protein